MIKNLRKIGFLLAAGLGLGSLNASAQLYVPFNGTGALVTPTSNWITHSGTTGQVMLVDGSLMFAGLPASQGNKIVLKSTDAEDVNTALVAPVTSGAAYASFLINVQDAAALLGNTTTGNYFMHFAGAGGVSSSTSPYVSRVSIRAGSEANTFNIGVLNSSSGTTGNTAPDIFGAAPVNYVVGQTYLVVVKYDMATNMSSVWVNPTPGSAETAGMVTNGSGTESARIETVAFRQSNSGTGGTGNIQIDELRAGTTFAAVTPSTTTGIKDFAAGNLALYPNPTTGAIKLQLPASFGANGKYNLTVFKVTGEVLLKASGSEKTLNTQLSSKFNNITAGVYLVTIDGGGQSFQTKIIKN